jgi:hypothetical protein
LIIRKTGWKTWHGNSNKIGLALLKLAVCNQISKIGVQFASVAQLVEQLTLNQLVVRSSRTRGTLFLECIPAREVVWVHWCAAAAVIPQSRCHSHRTFN